MNPEETLSESEIDQPVSEDEKGLLDARLLDAAEHPEDESPWTEVRARLTVNPPARNRIVVDAAILPGKPIIRGTRLSVEFVVRLLADGWSEADVLRNYPNLVHEDIVACLRYAAEVLRAEKVYPIVTA